MERDYYADLELSHKATAKEIKKNHKDLALKFHPDKNPGNQEAVKNFQIIQTAYEILSDPKTKAAFDEQRRKQVPQEYPTPRQRNQAPWRAQGERVFHSTNSKAAANNGAQPYMGNGAPAKGRAPDPPPSRTASARRRAEAPFGAKTNSYPRNHLGDEPPAQRCNYNRMRASSPKTDTSARAPPPVPERRSQTAKTDLPNTVNSHTMDKGNTPPAASSPPHQPPEFPFRQPAQTMSSHHPLEPSEQPQQPAGSKQSSSTIPTPSASQDINDKRQSDNSPNADKKRALRFPTPPTSDPQDFGKYLEEWNLFKNKIIGHYVAREKEIEKLQNSMSDREKYYEWLIQDDDLRGLFIEAGEEHEKQFRKVMKF